MGEIIYDEEKLRELVLYIARQCASHPLFGYTKLNKLLFFSDFIAYEQLGQPITGAEYMALEFGPGPRRLVPIREDMLIDGDITIEHSGAQRRIVAQRSPDLEHFSPAECKLVDKVIKALEHQDADRVSELSHMFLGWKAAWAETLATGKPTTIPYETVHVSNKPLSESELTTGKAVMEKHGWSFE